MLSLLNDMHDPLGRIMTLYRRNVQQYCSSVHDIKRNQCPEALRPRMIERSSSTAPWSPWACRACFIQVLHLMLLRIEETVVLLLVLFACLLVLLIVIRVIQGEDVALLLVFVPSFIEAF